LLALGVWSAVALGAGNDKPGTSTVATTTTTAPTTTGATAATTATTTVVTAATTTVVTAATTTVVTAATTTVVTAASTTTAAGSRVWLCHHTGSWKHPYRPIHISTHALQAHLRHGDAMPGANNSCPTTQPSEAKTHGHGNGQAAKPSGDGNDDQNEATDTNGD
jgi:hypothetical protein